MNKYVATILVVATLALLVITGVPAIITLGIPMFGAAMAMLAAAGWAFVWMVARVTEITARIGYKAYRLLTWPIRRAFATMSAPYYRAKARNAGRKFRGQVHPIPA
jgi:hypothetical protein